MAQDKTSFLLYCDIIHTVKKLPKDKAGELFMTILRYVNDENPEVNDVLVDLVFEPIKQQLKRDLKHWEGIKDKRSQAGKMGGLKSGEARKKTNEANEANASNDEANEANEAVTVNGNVIVNVNDNNDIHPFASFWDLYGKKKDTQKCQLKWSRLKDSEKELIMLSLPDYIKKTPDLKFRKNPLTWLNGSCWLDEIETPKVDSGLTHKPLENNEWV